MQVFFENWNNYICMLLIMRICHDLTEFQFILISMERSLSLSKRTLINFSHNITWSSKLIKLKNFFHEQKNANDVDEQRNEKKIKNRKNKQKEDEDSSCWNGKFCERIAMIKWLVINLNYVVRHFEVIWAILDVGRIQRRAHLNFNI